MMHGLEGFVEIKVWDRPAFAWKTGTTWKCKCGRVGSTIQDNDKATASFIKHKLGRLKKGQY